MFENRKCYGDTVIRRGVFCGKLGKLCADKARILLSLGLNYSSREIEVFSVRMRRRGDFQGGLQILILNADEC